jgi:hypothetical protein
MLLLTIFNFRISIGNGGAQTHSMGHDIISIPEVSRKKRDVLKTRRDSLFNEYTKHPHKHELALEIKKLDDEIAECVLKEQEKSQTSKARR